MFYINVALLIELLLLLLLLLSWKRVPANEAEDILRKITHLCRTVDVIYLLLKTHSMVTAGFH
jgi:predicted MFS family arabinose efflux permease